MMYFVLIILILFVFYAIGHLLTHITGFYKIKYTFSSLFTKISIGLVVAILSYSILKTSGKTINTGILCLFILYFLIKYSDIAKTRFQFNLNQFIKELIADSKTFLRISPFLIAFFLWQFFFIHNTNSINPTVVAWDNRFIADLAMFLNFSGKETLTWNYYNINEIGNSPYHYFEGWLVSFSSLFFKNNYWLVLQIVVIPIIQFIILIGTWSVFEHFKINRILRIFSFSLIFISGFYFPFLSNNFSIFQFTHTWFYGFNAIDEPWFFKISFAYIIFIWFIHLFINQKYSLSLVVLLIMPIISINTAPVLLSTIFLVIFINCLFKYKFFGPVFSWGHLFFPFFTGTFILIFYKLFGNSQIVDFPKPNEILSNLFNQNILSFYELKTFIKKILSAFFLYSPFVLIILLFFILNYKKLKIDILKSNLLKFSLMFLLILINTGILIWFILSETYGSWEFFFTTFLPLINFTIFFISYFILISSNVNHYHKILFGSFYLVLILTLIYRSFSIAQKNKMNYENQYSNQFISEVKASAKNLNIHGAKIQDPEDFYKREILFNPYLNLSAMYLNNVFSQYSLTNLSFADIDTTRISNKIYIQQLRSSPILKYIDSLKKENIFVSRNEAKLQFILDHNIEFIVVEKDIELDSSFNSLILKIISDPISNEKFVILKKK